MLAGTRAATRTKPPRLFRSNGSSQERSGDFTPESRGLGGVPGDLRIAPGKHLGKQRARGTDKNITKSGFTQRHERWVPLVEAGVADRHKQRNEGPLPSPPVALAPNP